MKLVFIFILKPLKLWCFDISSEMQEVFSCKNLHAVHVSVHINSIFSNYHYTEFTSSRYYNSRIIIQKST